MSFQIRRGENYSVSALILGSDVDLIVEESVLLDLKLGTVARFSYNFKSFEE